MSLFKQYLDLLIVVRQNKYHVMKSRNKTEEDKHVLKEKTESNLFKIKYVQICCANMFKI